MRGISDLISTPSFAIVALQSCVLVLFFTTFVVGTIKLFRSRTKDAAEKISQRALND